MCQIDPDPGPDWTFWLELSILADVTGSHWAVDDLLSSDPVPDLLPQRAGSWPVNDATVPACLALTLGSWFAVPSSMRKGLPELPSYKVNWWCFKKGKKKPYHFWGLSDWCQNPSTVETTPSARSRSWDRATAHAGLCPLAQRMW